MRLVSFVAQSEISSLNASQKHHKEYYQNYRLHSANGIQTEVKGARKQSNIPPLCTYIRQHCKRGIYSQVL